MISTAERVILMAFVRDWYAVTSNEYTGETRELLLSKSRNAGEVVDELHGMYDARTDEDDAADLCSQLLECGKPKAEVQGFARAET